MLDRAQPRNGRQILCWSIQCSDANAVVIERSMETTISLRIADTKHTTATAATTTAGAATVLPAEVGAGDTCIVLRRVSKNTPFEESGTTSTEPSHAPGQSSIIRWIASKESPPDSVLTRKEKKKTPKARTNLRRQRKDSEGSGSFNVRSSTGVFKITLAQQRSCGLKPRCRIDAPSRGTSAAVGRNASRYEAAYCTREQPRGKASARLEQRASAPPAHVLYSLACLPP